MCQARLRLAQVSTYQPAHSSHLIGNQVRYAYSMFSGTSTDLGIFLVFEPASSMDESLILLTPWA